jgi:hypothetical protein
MRAFVATAIGLLVASAMVFGAVPSAVAANAKYCCCIKGGNCVGKTDDNKACDATDFGYSTTQGPNGLNLYVKDPTPGGSCAEEPLNYCRCVDTENGLCRSFSAVRAFNSLDRFTCDNDTTDPHDCAAYCSSINLTEAYCGTDPKRGSVDAMTSISAGGCAPNHCWCLNSGGYCEHYAYTGDGGTFMDQQQCEYFCAARPAAAGETWTAKWQQNFKDLYTIDSSAGGCKFKPKQTVLQAHDFTDNLRQDAAKLNVLKFRGPADFIGNGIRIILMFIGSIVLVMYIFGGFLWMTASGNSEQVDKAKKILVWSSLGVVAMLASYVLVTFLFKTVLQLPI